MSVDVSPDGKHLVFDLLGDLYTLRLFNHSYLDDYFDLRPLGLVDQLFSIKRELIHGSSSFLV